MTGKKGGPRCVPRNRTDPLGSRVANVAIRKKFDLICQISMMGSTVQVIRKLLLILKEQRTATHPSSLLQFLGVAPLTSQHDPCNEGAHMTLSCPCPACDPSQVSENPFRSPLGNIVRPEPGAHHDVHGPDLGGADGFRNRNAKRSESRTYTDGLHC